MEKQALADLESLLYAEQGWIKVHAAEFLLWQSQLVDEVKAEFLREERHFGAMPKYRIGIWRVLAQASATAAERKRWENRIVEAFADVNGPDRLHAIETLAKLKHPVAAEEVDLGDALVKEMDAFALYLLWNTAYRPGEHLIGLQERLVSLLEAEAATGQHQLIPVLSFIIRNLRPLGEAPWKRTYRVAMAFGGAADVRASLLATARITVPPGVAKEHVAHLEDELLAMKNEKGVPMQLFYALSEAGHDWDIRLLKELYADARDRNRVGYDADIHATAAYAVLKNGGGCER